MTPPRLADFLGPVHNRRAALNPQRAGSPPVVHTINTPYDGDLHQVVVRIGNVKQATR
jgi:hypothetical protein